MNKLLATLIAGAFVASSTMVIAQTAAPAPAPATPPAASSGATQPDSMKHEGMKKSSRKHAVKKAKKKAAIVKEDKMIKSNTHSSNSAVKNAPATGGAAMKSDNMKSETKGK